MNSIAVDTDMVCILALALPIEKQGLYKLPICLVQTGNRCIQCLYLLLFLMELFGIFTVIQEFLKILVCSIFSANQRTKLYLMCIITFVIVFDIPSCPHKGVIHLFADG